MDIGFDQLVEGEPWTSVTESASIPSIHRETHLYASPYHIWKRAWFVISLTESFAPLKLGFHVGTVRIDFDTYGMELTTNAPGGKLVATRVPCNIKAVRQIGFDTRHTFLCCKPIRPVCKASIRSIVSTVWELACRLFHSKGAKAARSEYPRKKDTKRARTVEKFVAHDWEMVSMSRFPLRQLNIL